MIWKTSIRASYINGRHIFYVDVYEQNPPGWDRIEFRGPYNDYPAAAGMAAEMAKLFQAPLEPRCIWRAANNEVYVWGPKFTPQEAKEYFLGGGKAPLGGDVSGPQTYYDAQVWVVRINKD